MSLTPQFLDELRARTLLSALIGRSVKIQRAGREWKACCPFHQEKTPSFTINDDKGFYHCFGCGVHGDAIRFLTEAQGLPFMDAVKELAAAAGMDVPAPDPRAQERSDRAAGLHEIMAAAAKWFEGELAGLRGAEARAYLRERGIGDATAAAFGFGFAPDSRNRLKEALGAHGVDRLVECGLLIKPDDGGREPYDRFRGRLMIPIRDARGRVIAFGGRVIGAGEPKYLNSPETPLFDKGRTLFNLDGAGPASRKANRIVVVEGYMDVIALAQAGIAEAVAPLGTALTEGQLERLWRLCDVPLLCFDGDAAGQKAAVRAAVRALPMLAPGRTLRFAILPVGQDPDDVIRSDGVDRFNQLLEQAIPLHEMIWNAEVAAMPLSTPEARASLGKRLRDHARSITDPDVRTHYLGLFNGNVDEMFASVKREGFARRTKRPVESRQIPPEMRAIADHGVDQSVMARAALMGLLRHTRMMPSLSEQLSLLWIKNRDWARVREAMLDVSLGYGALEWTEFRSILATAGIDRLISEMEKPFDLAFSFMRGNADRDRAESELAAVVEILAAGPDLEAAIRAAIKRFENPHEASFEDANFELERLTSLKRRSEEKFSERWREASDA